MYDALIVITGVLIILVEIAIITFVVTKIMDFAMYMSDHVVDKVIYFIIGKGDK